MTRNVKKNEQDEQDEQKEQKEQDEQDYKSKIIPTDTWINRTKSKRGFIIYVKDRFKPGDILLGGTEAMQEFLDEERTGINLGRLIPEEETE